MPTLCVHVQCGDQSSTTGCRVCLEFEGGLVGGGFSDDEYTDSSGNAYFTVDQWTSGTVYVDGNDERGWGWQDGSVIVAL